MSERVTMAVAALMGGLAWGALAYLILTEPPSGWALVAFFPLVTLALAGTAAPLLRLLHCRLIPRKKRPGPFVALRQGLWVGLFFAVCAALQLARQLDWVLALILALVFVLLERFVQRRI